MHCVAISEPLHRPLNEQERKHTQRAAIVPGPVALFWALTLATLLASLAIAAWGSHRHLAQTAWDPLSDPLLGDLMEYPATYQTLHTAAFFNNAPPFALPHAMFSAVAYPPFAAAVLAPLYRDVSPVWGFLAASLAWLSVALWKARQLLLRHAVPQQVSNLFLLTLLLTSFPLARLVHQGNVEVLVWICVAAGTWAFLQGKDVVAAVAWGLAGALKLYPFVLLALLLPRRKPRTALAGLLTGAAVSWGSLWWLGPTVQTAWKGSLQNVFGYQDLRAAEWSLRELAANHSWFGWVKLAAALGHVPSQKLVIPYGICGLALLFWAMRRLWSMPTLNQLLAICVFMLGFPPVSYFHTLVHLYVPLLLLVCVAFHAQRKAVILRGLQETLLLFVPLFAPYTLLLFPRALLFSGLLQSLALFLLFLCALSFPFPGPTGRQGTEDLLALPGRHPRRLTWRPTPLRAATR